MITCEVCLECTDRQTDFQNKSPFLNLVDIKTVALSGHLSINSLGDTFSTWPYRQSLCYLVTNECDQSTETSIVFLLQSVTGMHSWNYLPHSPTSYLVAPQ